MSQEGKKQALRAIGYLHYCRNNLQEARSHLAALRESAMIVSSVEMETKIDDLISQLNAKLETHS